MIEIRLRAAGSSPLSRRRRWWTALAAMVIGVVAPVTTSRAQDAPAFATVEGAESVSIRSGAASITLRKDGTIVLKGVDIVLDDGKARVKPSTSRASEVF